MSTQTCTKNVHSQCIQNSPKLESISRKVNKQIVTHSYSGIILSNKNIHNKNESQNTVISKEAGHKRVHTIGFHLYVVQNRKN